MIFNFNQKNVPNLSQVGGKAKAFIDQHGVLLAGGWGVGMDMANWLCGMENLMVLMFQEPDFVSQILEMIHQWNKQRMEVVLSEGVDLYIRRAWYEGCDFVMPKFYQREILPRLKAEVDECWKTGKYIRRKHWDYPRYFFE